jgi:GNAT superfamily N-acetyltransferase
MQGTQTAIPPTPSGPPATSTAELDTEPGQARPPKNWTRRPGHRVMIRVARANDLAAISDFFAGLSLRSRYQRFFAPVMPSQALLRRLTGAVGCADVLVAVRHGAIIGHAMAADASSSGGPGTTEIGLVVADQWQGRGVGAALLRTLISRAQSRGASTVVMDVLPANKLVLGMIGRRWPDAAKEVCADFITVRAQLREGGRRLLAAS